MDEITQLLRSPLNELLKTTSIRKFLQRVVAAEQMLKQALVKAQEADRALYTKILDLAQAITLCLEGNLAESTQPQERALRVEGQQLWTRKNEGQFEIARTEALLKKIAPLRQELKARRQKQLLTQTWIGLGVGGIVASVIGLFMIAQQPNSVQAAVKAPTPVPSVPRPPRAFYREADSVEFDTPLPPLVGIIGSGRRLVAVFQEGDSLREVRRGGTIRDGWFLEVQKNLVVAKKGARIRPIPLRR